MKFGVLLPSRRLVMESGDPERFREIIDLAQSAEEAGLDSVWVGDSLTAKPRTGAAFDADGGRSAYGSGQAGERGAACGTPTSGPSRSPGGDGRFHIWREAGARSGCRGRFQRCPASRVESRRRRLRHASIPFRGGRGDNVTLSRAASALISTAGTFSWTTFPSRPRRLRLVAFRS